MLYRLLRDSGRRKPDVNSRCTPSTARRSRRTLAGAALAVRPGVAAKVGGWIPARSPQKPGPVFTQLARQCADSATVGYRRALAAAWRPRRSETFIGCFIARSAMQSHGVTWPSIQSRTPSHRAPDHLGPNHGRPINCCSFSKLRGRIGSSYVGLAATTGMRRSELAHVDRDGLDLARGLLEIRLTRVVVAGRAQESDGKTENSRRAISLDTLTVDALKSHVAMLDDEREAFGDVYPTACCLSTRRETAASGHDHRSVQPTRRSGASATDPAARRPAYIRHRVTGRRCESEDRERKDRPREPGVHVAGLHAPQRGPRPRCGANDRRVDRSEGTDAADG
jgi:hypothetical protein